MEKKVLVNLELRTPLFYAKIAEMPRLVPKSGEFLLCYELNSAQSRSIEPNRELFLGKLVFIGQKPEEDAENKGELSLLPGNYLFMQSRADKVMDQEEWLDMAIEQQKDGLWERHKPKNLLYVRYLYEDGAFTTQVFRPL